MLNWLDWTVLIGYITGTIIFGLWLTRKIKSSQGYFLGERKLPWWIMIGQAFSTGTNAQNPVAQAGAAYHFGFSTIWYQWKNMLITPYYWLIAPWYRRSERTTIGEFFDDRYGRKLGLLYSIFAIFYFIFIQGAMLKGAAKIIAVSTGGAISPNQVVGLMTAAFVLYSFFGGLVAAAYTDIIQGFLIIILSFMLIPSGISAIGGFDKLAATLPPDFFTLYSDKSGMTAFTIAMLAINGMVGITAQPHMLTMCATGKSERAGRIGQTYGSLVKRVCTIGWAFAGLIIAVLLIQRGETLPDPEQTFGYGCRNLLAPGLVGLMVACVLATNMAACSNFMINSGALFTHNLYKSYIDPKASDHRLLYVGRFSSLCMTALGVLFALYVDQVLDAFLFTETLPALLGIMLLGGILWKRANRWGAWASLISSFVVYYGLNYLMVCGLQPGSTIHKNLTIPFNLAMDAWREGRLMTFLDSGEFHLVCRWMPGPYGWATLVGFVLLIIVSLITPREDAKKIEQFFDKQRRTSDLPPTGPDHRRPLASDVGQDLLLLDFGGWLTRERWRGFFRRYREDVVGFLLGWLTVIILILIAWLLMQITKT
jgi:SSS family transporter